MGKLCCGNYSQIHPPTTKFWGYHLILDVHGCDPEKSQDQEYLTAWVKDLVKTIEMIPYGEPQVLHFGKDDPKLAGWTALQLIETSNIVAHFCDDTGDLYLDVFSCKWYDKQDVVNHVKQWFAPKCITTQVFVKRDATPTFFTKLFSGCPFFFWFKQAFTAFR